MITWIIIKLRNATIVLQYELSNQIQQFKSFAEPKAEVGSSHDCHHCHNSSLDINPGQNKKMGHCKCRIVENMIIRDYKFVTLPFDQPEAD